MRALNLTPLIDVLFILIIFFMLTTSFMRIESMELILPATAQKTSAQKNEDVIRLYLSASGDIALGQRKLKSAEVEETLSRMLTANPDIRIMLLTADGVTMQQLVSMMDRISLMGGKSLMVRKWTARKAI